MTATPLPPLPKEFACTNGLWGYYTADQMQAYATAARADLEAEVARLREALQIAHDHLDMARLRATHYKDAAKINAALEKQACKNN